ncbi:hypothetical protein [Mangrovihabitans endophyticus]|uniref:DUF732 domain-containing protein n=1 Tax=Mangrovihabitans endophyticus TaxID=1751298 RepID=A0A8J3BYJ8_9ACTN|nr:hypothetical protein [Mangrovihabitans endophyticus]GGK89314.1 hypothetical protein GCM10012284_24120 [Mangrovihabitans endophyticus]
MITAGVAVACLAACGSETPAAADTETSTAPATATDEIEPAAAEAYLAGLRQIDPGLAGNESRAVRRAEETCADIAAGEFTGDKLAERVAERLSGGSATINASQAKQAIDLMETYVC